MGGFGILYVEMIGSFLEVCFNIKVIPVKKQAVNFISLLVVTNKVEFTGQR